MMNYVEHINLFGEDVKEIPCIKGEGEPTTETKGQIGCFYMDTLTGSTYKCIAGNSEENYTWISNEPLHIYDIIHLPNVAYEDMFDWKGEGNPYTNSFNASIFSRKPQNGEIFSFIFTDMNNELGFGVFQITDEVNDSGYYPFEMLFASRYYKFSKIEEMKAELEGIKTEDWTFYVEGSETPILKKVCVKQ